jgi:hypothetical protein
MQNRGDGRKLRLTCDAWKKGLPRIYGDTELGKDITTTIPEC